MFNRFTFKYFNKENGFTMIEMVLTLFITCSLVFIPVINFDRVMKRIETRNFIEQIQSELFYLQSVAIVNGEKTRFTVYPNLRKIQCVTTSETYSIAFPDTVERMGKGVKNYCFEPHTGNLGNFERLPIRTENETYYIKFQLGSGRFYVEKI